MHKYLRAIGFQGITNEQLDRLYFAALKNPDRISRSQDGEGNLYSEYRIAVSKGVGIAFRGRQGTEESFRLEYYFPYIIGSVLSTKEKFEVVKSSDREGYHGMCDELNLGVELIFFLQDMVPHATELQINNPDNKSKGIRLAALAANATVVLPIRQTVGQVKRTREFNSKRQSLMFAARNGDEEAIEELAKREMDLYAKANLRAESEDILTIVNSYFMPEGIESDKYSILGTITSIKKSENSYTGESIQIMTLNCNHIRFDLCVNSMDLVGEPAVGRRLRANIWMQGMFNQ